MWMWINVCMRVSVCSNKEIKHYYYCCNPGTIYIFHIFIAATIITTAQREHSTHVLYAPPARPRSFSSPVFFFFVTLFVYFKLALHLNGARGRVDRSGSHATHASLFIYVGPLVGASAEEMSHGKNKISVRWRKGGDATMVRTAVYGQFFFFQNACSARPFSCSQLHECYIIRRVFLRTCYNSFVHIKL